MPRLGTLEATDPGDVCSSGSDWIEFTSPDQDFAVDVPATPVSSSDAASTPVGKQTVVRFKTSANGCEFDSGFLQRSPSVLAKLVGEDAILKSACEGTASHLGGHVMKGAALTIDGKSAREFTIVFPNDSHHQAQARLVITDERIYHAIITTPQPPSREQASTARHFLDSFHLHSHRN